ncbi:EamA family transporter [Sporanaerobium hydrogeniformans]|uniref:EamA family transporter n=1 Tax=Sporanaerobium hydrogeniformans TaxID=3072179 RepID=A0AC61DGX5_9FIRM|nr:DMT family transporter [Sporanaerobium hydrogeniformans]PHV71827.1 EamA family transporter [Sporanaerobium hydrogeniformans]
MKNNHQKGIVLLLVTAFLWSLGGVLIKGITWNSMGVAGTRSLIAALTILCLTGKPKLHFTWPRIWAILAYAGTVLIFVVSTKLTTAANAILLQYTAPIYTAFFGYVLLKEPVHKKDVVSIVIILGGMVIFFIESLSGGNLVGDALALFSGVTFSLMTVFMRMEKDNDPVQCIFWGNLLAFFIALPFMGKLEWNISNGMGILILGTCQLGISYILYSKAIVHVTALEGVLIPILEPILNPIWVMLVQREVPSFYTFLGGAIVILGVVSRSIEWKKEGIKKEQVG